MSRDNLDKGLIYTDSQNCIGCNNCIRQCPTLEANVGEVDVNGVCKMHLDGDKCILCGTCRDTCTHNVRKYRDDSARFFRDLQNGKKISLLIAPAFLLSYASEYKHILGYLKSLGVDRFFSVSFGADITTWAYLNYVTKNNAYGKISQPCPAIVSYMEKHHPEFLEHLMPVQSPMMCAAIYLKQYQGLSSDIAFLSPCIAKKEEIESPRGKGLIKYNVTFISLMEHIRRAGVNLKTYVPLSDEIDYGLGSLYPMPGGLRENVEFYLGDEAFVVQAEGELHVYNYLSNFEEHRAAWRRTGVVPTLVDVLNCARGCAYGTASEFRNTESSQMQVEAYLLKRAKRAKLKELSEKFGGQPGDNLAALNKRFENLSLGDFMCKYQASTQKSQKVSREEIERVYTLLHKHTESEKKFDCGACGYKSCQTMAEAMVLDINYKENCSEYVKVLVKEQMEYQNSVISHFKEVSDLISQLDGDNIKIFEDTSNITTRVSSAVEYGEHMNRILSSLQDEFQKLISSYGQISAIARTTNILSINASIESAHAGAQGLGFRVIADEMRTLAQRVLQVAGKSESDSNSISSVLEDLLATVNNFISMVHEVKDTADEIKSKVSSITGSTSNIMELVRSLEGQ